MTEDKNEAMKTFLIAAIVLTSLTVQSQVLEQRLSSAKPNYARYVPLGVVSGMAGTIIGNTIGGKNLGIAGGVMFSLASSLLVRNRTDAITSLYTAGSGFVCTTGLTIGLNTKRGRGTKRSSVECFKF